MTLNLITRAKAERMVSSWADDTPEDIQTT